VVAKCAAKDNLPGNGARQGTAKRRGAIPSAEATKVTSEGGADLHPDEHVFRSLREGIGATPYTYRSRRLSGTGT